jgi:predicted DCC family thiol-disulfide oxidoreductase YuxK
VALLLTQGDRSGMDHPDLIVFDATCVFCSGFARFMAARDRGRFRFVTAHSPTGQALYAAHGLNGRAMKTNVVITQGRAHVLPVSATTETVEGPRARFDVALSLPWTGPILRYRGWLVSAPLHPTSG